MTKEKQPAENARKIDRSAMRPLVCSLDLEYNQPSKKIIQIGAVIGDLTTGEVVSRFSVFANPGEALNPAIIKLTGIQQSDVDAADDLADGYRLMLDWLQPFNARRTLNPLTWGGGDSQDLRDQLGLPDNCWGFGRRWTDVKTVYIAWRASQQRPGDGGLARSLTKLGLVFQGRRHNALDDAENTFRVYVALLKQFRAEQR